GRLQRVLGGLNCYGVSSTRSLRMQLRPLSRSGGRMARRETTSYICRSARLSKPCNSTSRVAQWEALVDARFELDRIVASATPETLPSGWRAASNCSQVGTSPMISRVTIVRIMAMSRVSSARDCRAMPDSVRQVRLDVDGHPYANAPVLPG